MDEIRVGDLIVKAYWWYLVIGIKKNTVILLNEDGYATVLNGSTYLPYLFSHGFRVYKHGN